MWFTLLEKLLYNHADLVLIHLVLVPSTQEEKQLTPPPSTQPPRMEPVVDRIDEDNDMTGSDPPTHQATQEEEEEKQLTPPPSTQPPRKEPVVDAIDEDEVMTSSDPPTHQATDPIEQDSSNMGSLTSSIVPDSQEVPMEVDDDNAQASTFSSQFPHDESGSGDEN